MINQTIFRAYDIRGIYNEQITDETAYILGKSFGSYIQLRGKKEVLVGYDNRLSSPNLAGNLIKGLLETGVNVTNLGLVIQLLIIQVIITDLKFHLMRMVMQQVKR